MQTIIPLVDRYAKEILQLSRSIQAARNQLSISGNPHETEFLQQSIDQLTEQRSKVVQRFNEITPAAKVPK